ncbi:AEC family transporter [[Clostridium] symbiosum]|uniref:AEC family transporter n=1 Tax=Clostridium symbiosum TaxID=1512 RepID=UPI001D096130|nr:AEC family transporter [[Clostridium] symbiosum]MCB6610944.1 AEC family transporter [[Clostridium] symbiosum]MCB6932086.1 AEC family transporter [[Clostridium] symbiosum]
MEIVRLFNLQGSLFIMILAGAVLKRKGIIDEPGKRCLTDLCVNIIIPCNIIKSCLMEFDLSIMKACGLLLVVGIVMQFFCLFLNRFLFNGFGEQQKKVLQYCTIVSNGGFLGNPVAEGVYGSLGLLYASIFLIPMRVVMWSAGTSYFVAGTSDKKKVLHNILTHPCLVAVYIGLFLMFTQIHVPEVLASTVKSIGGCNSAITMFIIGTILADVDVRTIINRTTVGFSIFRLVLLPAAALALSHALGLDPVASGVAVIMTGMPAGATAAIFAARYGSDAEFATKCVVLSTLLSMVTIPMWVM